MNPIEEMMRKYGVETIGKLGCAKCRMRYKNPCIELPKCPLRYPDFTPEKQLEIIKLISQRTTFGLEIEEKHKHTIFTINTDFGSIGHFTFEKALAEFLTNIFYYCSNEAQKQQIKEILE